MFLNPQYNSNEQSLMASAPVGGQQSPLDAVALGALRTKAMGTSGGSAPMSAVGALLGSTPAGAALGMLSGAMGQEDPSQTATSGGSVSAKYGDKYVSSLANSSKAGAFNVSSGNARAEADISSATTSPLNWKQVAIWGGALILVAFLWRRFSTAS